MARAEVGIEIVPHRTLQRPAQALLLGPDGEQVPLPEEVYRVVLDVVAAVRGQGHY